MCLVTHNQHSSPCYLLQMLHIVDRVITPTYPRGVDLATINTAYLTPDAQKLLLKPHYYGLEGPHSIA